MAQTYTEGTAGRLSETNLPTTIRRTTGTIHFSSTRIARLEDLQRFIRSRCFRPYTYTTYGTGGRYGGGHRVLDREVQSIYSLLCNHLPIDCRRVATQYHDKQVKDPDTFPQCLRSSQQLVHEHWPSHWRPLGDLLRCRPQLSASASRLQRCLRARKHDAP